MKNLAGRSVFILGVSSIVCIVGMQIYLLRQAFDLRENQFNQSVQIALKAVSENLAVLSRTTLSLDNPVIPQSSSCFVVYLNHPIDVNLLELNLQNEFRNVAIKTDFEYGIYDCYTNKMKYGNYICMNPKNCNNVRRTALPKYEGFDYYFVVNFPAKNAYLMQSMELWFAISIVFLLVIIFFSWTMFIIVRQRFLSQVQKDFMNNLTHEFKTPITSITISANVLSNPSIAEEPQRMQQYVKYIQKEIGRLDQLVEKVLQITRIEKNSFRLDMQYVSLHSVIADVVDQFIINGACAQNEIKLQLCAEHEFVHADVLHFSNLMYNLIDNAIKYSPNEVSVLISSSVENKYLVIAIKDLGMGIDKQYLDKIFERFYRIPTGNIHNVKGFGIGLNYVRHIVRAHKWRIRVHSKPNRGTTFILKIPVNIKG